MATVLALSSQVVRGHVGLSAIVPTLQRLGHDVWPMPTIVLSNHPGHKRAIATHLPLNTLEGIVDALDANGWLGAVDAVLTGYMPSVEHVMVARRTIAQVRQARPDATVLVDPIMGDDPKGLYVDVRIATAIRENLVPLASAITPNRFELAWLSGKEVVSPQTAVAAARSLGVHGEVVATSVPDGSGHLANLVIEAHGAEMAKVVRLIDVPHGTGDMLSGLYLGHRLRDGCTAGVALGRAVAGVAVAIAGSLGQEELRLVATLDAAIATAPLATTPVTSAS